MVRNYFNQIKSASIDKIISDISSMEKTLRESDGQIFLLERTTHIDDYTNVDGGVHIHSGMRHDTVEERIFGVSTKPYLIRKNVNTINKLTPEIVGKWLGFGLLQSDTTENPEDVLLVTSYHFSLPRFYTGENIVIESFLTKGNVVVSYRDISGLMYGYRSEPNSFPAKLEKQVIKFQLTAGNEAVKKILVGKYKNGGELFEDFKDFLTHPEKIQQIDRYNLNKEKEGIINQLEGLLKREAEIDESIKSVYASIKNGGFMRGGAAVLVEDNDDAMVVTLGDREKLEGVRNSIRFALAEARRKGMDKDNIEYIITHSPGKTTKIKIDEYITNLALKYGKKGL